MFLALFTMFDYPGWEGLRQGGKLRKILQTEYANFDFQNRRMHISSPGFPNREVLHSERNTLLAFFSNNCQTILLNFEQPDQVSAPAREEEGCRYELR